MGIVDPSLAVEFYDLSSMISRKFTFIGFFFRYEDGVLIFITFIGIQVEILNHPRMVRK